MVTAWIRCCSSPTPTPARPSEALDVALGVLREDADVEVATTSNPGELDGVLHRAGCRSIVVAGGDGSLHAVVAALHRRHELAEADAGPDPAGHRQRLRPHPGHPARPGRGGGGCSSRVAVRAMDLIVDELGGVVVNSVHAGASAQASRRGARWKERLGPFGFGILGYPIGAALAAVKPPFVRLRIEADGEVVSDMDQHVLMVAIGNGTSVGGGTELTPDADPEDGKLDVMVSLRHRAAGTVRLRRGTSASWQPPRARRRPLPRAPVRSPSPARTSSSPPTARSAAPSAAAPGTSSRPPTRWSCRAQATVRSGRPRPPRARALSFSTRGSPASAK